jgi:hypothetical protein
MTNRNALRARKRGARKPTRERNYILVLIVHKGLNTEEYGIRDEYGA